MNEHDIPAPNGARATFRHTRRGLLLMAGGSMLAACSSIQDSQPPQSAMPAAPEPAMPAQPANTLGTGAVKIALILPLGASGNAALAAQSLKNAADMAVAEFTGANIQLVVKDDGGTGPGAQTAAQQAVDEGCKAVIGPVFAHSVAAAGQITRSRNIPLVGFSTDTNVATRGVYLLSFLPQTDVVRAVRYAATNGKRAYAALLPDNAYGSVVEAAFRETVPATGGRVVGIERYAPGNAGQYAEAARRLAPTANQADALFLPDSADALPQLLQALTSAGVNLQGKQLIGTGLWDNPALFNAPALAGGIFAAPDPAGFKSFAQRYQQRFGQQPVRTATLSHDAVSLMAALVNTQGEAGLNDNAIQNPSGFAGIDGIFRFRSDGTNQRGLAVMKIANGSAQIVSPAPRSFAEQGF